MRVGIKTWTHHPHHNRRQPETRPSLVASRHLQCAAAMGRGLPEHQSFGLVHADDFDCIVRIRSMNGLLGRSVNCVANTNTAPATIASP